MYAVIATGGKQYKVKVDDYVDVELLDGEVGKEVVFDKVLAIGEEQGSLEVGAPVVAGAPQELSPHPRTSSELHADQDHRHSQGLTLSTVRVSDHEIRCEQSVAGE